MVEKKAPTGPKPRKWSAASMVHLKAVLDLWLKQDDKEARTAMLPDLYKNLAVSEGDKWVEKRKEVSPTRHVA